MKISIDKVCNIGTLHEELLELFAELNLSATSLVVQGNEDQVVITIDDGLQGNVEDIRGIVEKHISLPIRHPDWLKLATEFQFPGNPLYASVLGKVAAAGFVAQDHWQNFKLLLSTPNLQSVEAMAASIAHLDRLLAEAGRGLDNQDKASWNRLMQECSFPIECQLSNAPR
jgi:hypothetical protein